MKKTKRARSVLRALDKFVNCLTSCSGDFMKQLDAVKASVVDLGDSDSNAVKAACTKVAALIDKKMSELKVEAEASMQTSSANPTSSSSKKKKKKKKQKK
eukprot:scaffold319_cov97-Cylindrotheca_fusiformis.AAC.7